MQPADDYRADDPLRAAWLGQSAPPPLAPDLADRLRGHQRRRVAWRAFEIALSLGAIGVFVASALGEGLGPTGWLLLPFFAAYLPVIWWLQLRRPDPRIADASARDYARVRLAQLRRLMHEAWLARRGTDALLGYALLALAFALLAGSPTLREGAGWVLAAAVAAWLAARFALRPARRRWWRERLALRRLERDLAG